MARKDVDVRIRAKDEASRTARAISDALKKLGTDSEKAASGASKTGAALSSLASDLSRLEGRAAGLRGFEKMVGDLSRVGGAVSRLESDLERGTKRFNSIQAETLKAADATRDLNQAIRARQGAYGDQARQLDLQTAAQKKNNDTIRQAEKDLKSLNAARSARAGGSAASAGVGLEAGAPVSSARASFQAIINEQIAAANTEGARLQASVNGLKTAMSQTKGEIKGLETEANAAARAEKELAAETQRAGNAILAMRADIARTRGEMGALDAAARETGKSLGGLATSQDAVARATARTASQLAQMRGRVEGLASVTTPVIPRVETRDGATNQDAQLLNLQTLNRERAKAQDELRRLGQEAAAAAAPTTQLSEAIGRAQGRTRALTAAMAEQRAAINGTAAAATTGFGAWARAYNPIAGSADRAASAQRNANAAALEARRQALQIAPIVQRAGSAMGSAAGQTNAFGSSLRELGKDTRQSLSLMQRLRGEVLALAASYVGVQAAIQQGQGAVNAFRDVEAVESRLGAVFQQDASKISAEMDFLRGQADRLGISFSTLGQQYGKFAIASDAAGFSAENTRKIFLSVAEAGRVNKLSLDQLNGTFLAIEQIISKGKFTSEEVRRQLGDRLPGAFDTLADAMGVTTAELDKMMANGELLSTESNLLKFADQLTKRFGPQLSSSLNTFTADLGRYENAIFKARLALAEGFIPALREALQAFTAFSNSADGVQTFASIGQTVGRLIGVLAEVPKYFDLMRLAAQGFIAVKLAGFVSDTVQRMLAFQGAIGGVAQQMAFIGPQQQRMTLMQRTVGAAFAQSVGSIDRYRAALLASSALTGTMTTRTNVVVGALGVIRGAMFATANVARAMWIAIGGLPGVLITGIVFAIGKWMSGTNDATSALVEHQRQLNSVREKYQLIKDEVNAWGKAVSAVSETEARASLVRLSSAFEQEARKIQDAARVVRAAFSEFSGFSLDDPRVGQAATINDLADALASGAIDVESFRAATDAIAQDTSFDQEIRDMAAQLHIMSGSTEDGADSLEQLQAAIRESEAVLRVHEGTATEADAAILGLGDSVDDTNESFNDTSFVEAYEKAIDDLRQKIPGLADDLKRLKDITDLNTSAWTAMTAAWQTGDYGKLLEVANLWMRGRGEINNEQINSAIGGNLVDRIVGVESGGRADARNPNSSATGAGQFIESTWLAMFRKYFPEEASRMTEPAILELRKNADTSRKMVELYAAENARYLQRFGHELTDANLYLAHFLGPEGANKLLSAAPTTPVSQILEPGQISANQSILGGKNAGQVRNWAAEKMGITQQQLDIQEQIVEAENEAAETAADQAKTTRERIADLDHQIEQQKLINAGREREAAIQDAVRAAKADDENITEAQLAQIREQTGLLYDQQNSRKELELAEERLNQLYALRQSLLEQQQIAAESGDITRVGELKTQIEGINGQITAAIPGIIAMWESVGGPEADAAIAKIQTMAMSLKDAGKNTVAFGLNMDQITSLVGSFADGMVNGVDNFIKRLSEGQSAIGALAASFAQFAAEFLRQIALMILKQMTLNALMAFGNAIGGPLGGSIAQAAGNLGGRAGHTGGIVGTAAIGAGNPVGTPAWQRSMFTYHTGGRAGFAPDEVSATLKVNEEVLTQQDPRHRDNLGGERAAGGMARPQMHKQVLAIGDQEIANAMNGAAGEKVTVTHIKRNAQAIRQLLGVN